jgi:hypothetical protein
LPDDNYPTPNQITNQTPIKKGITNMMTAITTIDTASFETIDLLTLENINGGDFGAIVDAGNRAGNAGALIGGGVGAVAGGIGGAVGGTAVFPGPGSAAGAFGGAAAGAGVGAGVGGGIGWLGGAATETWRQTMPRWLGGR